MATAVTTTPSGCGAPRAAGGTTHLQDTRIRSALRQWPSVPSSPLCFTCLLPTRCGVRSVFRLYLLLSPILPRYFLTLYVLSVLVAFPCPRNHVHAQAIAPLPGPFLEFWPLHFVCYSHFPPESPFMHGTVCHELVILAASADPAPVRHPLPAVVQVRGQ